MFLVFTYSDLNQEKTKELLLQFVTSIIAPETLVEQAKASSDTSILIYTVQEGETCTDIAERFGITTELIAALNQLDEDCDTLIPGQTLDIPYQGEFWTQVDLNCDSRKENIYLFHPLENLDDPTITGVAIDVREAPGDVHRIWTYTSDEMGVISFEQPTFFSIGDCEQFLVIRGSIPGKQYRTIVFRTNGNSVWPVLDSVGWPLSPDGVVSNQAETEDEPFRVDLIEWGDEIEPGQCLNHNLRFRWTGERFEGFNDRYERGACNSS
ncbi:MAG: LysM peptidoglycan-binding domain-containing protein [Anaerolineales bacterium]|nr:LysM peptidoglycan-binding domain-containing protein [Anaerolineales bacterium]